MLEILESDINQVITRMYLLKKPKPTLEEIEYIVEEVTVDSIPKPLYFEEISDVKLGDKIILKNIFYDFDKSTLRPESIKELENLLAFLNKRPTLRIEISGHTDNKGSARYNKKLSEDRAKSVVTYLVEHGIDPARLEAKGYGFDEPIATNDTDEGRQLNRRTEFMVIGL
ncbi:MAG: Outer membrane porin F precursor [Bacteroidetes bacterium ADurb.Bin408]|nr:MAG: Outer membrane porin F precursor [Bacteroidetes bacterium ADurb.Bin408]